MVGGGRERGELVDSNEFLGEAMTSSLSFFVFFLFVCCSSVLALK